LTTLVLFDIDGTLFFGNGCGRAATKLAMQEVFGTYAGAEGHHFGGKTDWATLTMLLTPQGFSAQQIEEAMPRYDEAIGRHLAAIIGQYQPQAAPGGLELVQAVANRSDALVGVLTGNVSSTAPIKLASVGYDVSLFKIGAYGSEAPERTLLPPIALRRAEAYLEQKIDATVIIGDTPEDVTCARSIGARCLAVASGYAKKDELAVENPAALLDSLHDTETVLELLFG
jgi:phosphoglycolate phosphatase-like HAD superfamily hydrolase